MKNKFPSSRRFITNQENEPSQLLEYYFLFFMLHVVVLETTCIEVGVYT